LLKLRDNGEICTIKLRRKYEHRDSLNSTTDKTGYRKKKKREKRKMKPANIKINKRELRCNINEKPRYPIAFFLFFAH